MSLRVVVLCVCGVWLQPRRADHHPASKFLDRPSIFVEVGADFAAWEEMYARLLARELHKMGHSHEVAMQLAPQLIREERELPERPPILLSLAPEVARYLHLAL